MSPLCSVLPILFSGWWNYIPIRLVDDSFNTAIQIYYSWQTCTETTLTFLNNPAASAPEDSYKCSRGGHYFARRRLRDYITCCHSLGMIRMFLSNMLTLSERWAGRCWFSTWFPSRLVVNSQLDGRLSSQPWQLLLGTLMLKECVRGANTSPHE